MSSLRVLVAEDDLVNLKVASALLERLGIDMDLAPDGRIAAGLVMRNAYDVVLMDMQMPDVDGLEATRAIRAMELAHQPYIVALTANAFESDRKACLAAGMDDFLSKPFNLGQLRQQLELAAEVLSQRG